MYISEVDDLNTIFVLSVINPQYSQQFKLVDYVHTAVGQPVAYPQHLQAAYVLVLESNIEGDTRRVLITLMHTWGRNEPFDADVVLVSSLNQ